MIDDIIWSNGFIPPLDKFGIHGHPIRPRMFDPSGHLEADKQRFADHIMSSPKWFETNATVGGPVESWVLQIGQMTVNMDMIPV